ncbi:hypothetical protein ACR82Z_02935 [Mycoplasma sp. 6243]
MFEYKKESNKGMISVIALKISAKNKAFLSFKNFIILLANK